MIIEQDIQNFYKALTFGDVNDSVSAAVKKAYRDFCRTIKFEENKGVDHSNAVAKVIKVFRMNLERLTEIQSQESFDKWHEDICAKITGAFNDATLTLGQTQKWVNMAMKYLIALGEQPVIQLLPFLHAPIDSIVLEYSEYPEIDKLTPWSQIDSQEAYIKFQNFLRREKNKAPLEWEFGIWNESKQLKKRSVKTR